MTTTKNRINAYVGDTAFEAFRKFCQEYQVSLSRGVEILIQQSLLSNDVPRNLAQEMKAIATTIEAQKEKLARLEQQLSETLPDIQSELEKKLAARIEALIEERLAVETHREKAKSR